MNLARDALRTKLRGIVDLYPSTKRLLEVWPEVEPFLEDHTPDKITNLPVVLIDSLNREIGLPVKEKKE